MVRLFGIVSIALALAIAGLPVSEALAQASSKAYVNALRGGNKALAKGQLEAAAGAYQKAFEAADTTEVRMLLAQVYTNLGRGEDAIAVISPLLASSDPSEAQQAQNAFAAAAAVATPVPVTVDAGGLEAAIYVGGRRAANAGSPINLRPGKHELKAMLEGYGTAEKTISVMPGPAITVSMPLEALRGTVRLKTDSAGVVAKVLGQTFQLEPGQDATIDVPAGEVVVIFEIEGMDNVQRTFTVAPKATVDAEYLAFGSLIIAGIDQAVKVNLSGEVYDFAPGAPALTVEAGEHALIVAGEGLSPLRGDIVIQPGKTTTITVSPVAAPDYTTAKALGWTALGTGFALVLTTVILEETVNWKSGSQHDTVIWTLAGVGTALTLAGGVTLREVFAAQSNPDVIDTTFDVRVGFVPQKDGGFLSAGFTF